MLHENDPDMEEPILGKESSRIMKNYFSKAEFQQVCFAQWSSGKATISR